MVCTKDTVKEEGLNIWAGDVDVDFEPDVE
jgi:hypothetical protein